MKLVICFLADARSEHTVKWVSSLLGMGCTIHVISFRKNTISDAYIHLINGTIVSVSSDIRKLFYIRNINKIKKIIADIKPDIVHAHYATSYGLLGALSGFHPFVVSAWGSDIYEFPKKSLLHKSLLKFVLQRANHICATSNALKDETGKYTKKKIKVIPFGVNTEKFFSGNHVVDNVVYRIGTVKTLEKQYGIDILINAFNVLVKRYPDKNMELLIIGDGSEKENLQAMVRNAGLDSKVKFVGKIEHNLIPEYLRRMNVFVALSRRESFGVAILEASSCGLPVVVSNVGGLPEVVVDEQTGFIVPPDYLLAANAIEKIMLNKPLGIKMGIEGRKFVMRNYDWNQSIMEMMNVYQKIKNNAMST